MFGSSTVWSLSWRCYRQYCHGAVLQIVMSRGVLQYYICNFVHSFRAKRPQTPTSNTMNIEQQIQTDGCGRTVIYYTHTHLCTYCTNCVDTNIHIKTQKLCVCLFVCAFIWLSIHLPLILCIILLAMFMSNLLYMYLCIHLFIHIHTPKDIYTTVAHCVRIADTVFCSSCNATMAEGYCTAHVTKANLRLKGL